MYSLYFVAPALLFVAAIHWALREWLAFDDSLAGSYFPIAEEPSSKGSQQLAAVPFAFCSLYFVTPAVLTRVVAALLLVAAVYWVSREWVAFDETVAQDYFPITEQQQDQLKSTTKSDRKLLQLAANAVPSFAAPRRSLVRLESSS